MLLIPKKQVGNGYRYCETLTGAAIVGAVKMIGWPPNKTHNICTWHCTHLYNGVHWTRLLTEPTVDALGHVNVISGGPSTSICPCLCFDGDGLSRTNGLTQLTCNAPLLPIWVAPQGMLTTEPRADRTLLKRIVQCHWLSEEGTQSNCQTCTTKQENMTPHKTLKKGLTIKVKVA